MPSGGGATIILVSYKETVFHI